MPTLFKGVELEDCKVVSKLIGIKIFVNEFVAYSKLGKMIEFRKNITDSGLYELYKNGTYSLPDDVESMVWNVNKFIR